MTTALPSYTTPVDVTVDFGESPARMRAACDEDALLTGGYGADC